MNTLIWETWKMIVSGSHVTREIPNKTQARVAPFRSPRSTVCFCLCCHLDFPKFFLPPRKIKRSQDSSIKRLKILHTKLIFHKNWVKVVKKWIISPSFRHWLGAKNSALQRLQNDVEPEVLKGNTNKREYTHNKGKKVSAQSHSLLNLKKMINLLKANLRVQWDRPT